MNLSQIQISPRPRDAQTRVWAEVCANSLLRDRWLQDWPIPHTNILPSNESQRTHLFTCAAYDSTISVTLSLLNRVPHSLDRLWRGTWQLGTVQSFVTFRQASRLPTCQPHASAYSEGTQIAGLLAQIFSLGAQVRTEDLFKIFSEDCFPNAVLVFPRLF